MKYSILFMRRAVFCMGLFTLISYAGLAQNTPTICVGGATTYVLASGDAKFPMWLPAGTTLGCGTNVNSISVIEYLVKAGPATAGVAQNELQYNQVLNITSSTNPCSGTLAQVPANTVWKVEGVDLATSAYNSGAIGATGPTGPSGADGAPGATGPSGSGATGPTGPTGLGNASGSTGQVAYFSGPSSIISNANLTFSVNPAGSAALIGTNTSTTTSSAAIQGTETGNGNVIGVEGSVSSTTAGAAGVVGNATGASGAVFGVVGTIAAGTNTTAGAAGVEGIGVTTGAGYLGYVNSSIVNNGITITNPAGYFTGNGNTPLGTVSSGANSAIVGINTSSSGGAGGNFSAADASSTGVIGQNVNSSGTGVGGVGNNVSLASTLVLGSGGAFTGNSTGVYGYCSTGSNSTQGGTFQNGSTSVYAYVAAYSGFTNYKIIGTGSVSTVVDGMSGDKVVLHCPETPEIYFQDFGEGQLSNGRVHIDIDPTFSKNVVVNGQHPLRVFIQLEGDCRGTYTTNETQTGFDVVELQGGQSNVKFHWSITANRADEQFPDGRVSHNADQRFEAAPPVHQMVQTKLTGK